MQIDRMQRWGAIVVFVVLLNLIAGFTPGAVRDVSAGATYYVNCQNGNDANGGLSPTQAWRSLEKANDAPLSPGDRLLFARGCTWTGTLHARWNGTSSSPITIGAYGSGALPRIHNRPGDLADGYHNNVDISGSYQIIDSIETTIVDPPVHSGCQNNPIGFFIGFNFRNPANSANGGSHNMLRNSKATAQTAGVHTNTNTHHNRILYSEFSFNRVMQKLTPVTVGAYDDIGAWGILLKGSNHEVAYNRFADNRAYCTYDTPPQGNAVELYEARNNRIHHNRSINDRDFSELGGSTAVRSSDNVFAFNLVVSNVDDAHFIITRGGGNVFGPVFGTRLYNNTVYYTGANSEGIICGAGCGAQMLTARNNVIWAELKAIYADGAFQESHNTYWNSAGDPLVQFVGFALNGASRVENPGFVNPAANDFHLRPNSPAINNGTYEPIDNGYRRDLDGVFLPISGAVERGVYEFGFSASTPANSIALPIVFFSLP